MDFVNIFLYAIMAVLSVGLVLSLIYEVVSLKCRKFINKYMDAEYIYYLVVPLLDLKKGELRKIISSMYEEDVSLKKILFFGNEYLIEQDTNLSELFIALVEPVFEDAINYYSKIENIVGDNKKYTELYVNLRSFLYDIRSYKINCA